MDLIIDSLPKCKVTPERIERIRQLVFELPDADEMFADSNKKSVADEVAAEFKEVMSVIEEGGKYRFQFFDGMDYFVISKASNSSFSDQFHDALHEVDTIRHELLAWARADFLEIRPPQIIYDE